MPRIVGGAATTNVLILDLEYPFPWVHPCEYGTLNDTTLTAVVNATRLRIHFSFRAADESKLFYSDAQ